jgi:protein gp37
MSKRLKAMGQYNYRKGFELTLHEEALSIPYKWKKPVTVFVNSMSDLFHKDVPLEFIQKVFQVMNETPQHRYQVLTKRAVRLKELSPSLHWSENIWMGVSVENQDCTSRIDNLKKTGAYVKFLSVEPLLGNITNMNLEGIDWVIVGGESGPGARVLEENWVKSIFAACQDQEVPFFFKQWGGTNKKKTGRLFLGRTWDEMPRAAGGTLSKHKAA